MVVVYKITNLINNKIYIGVHRTDILNDNYYGSGKLIKRALKKYGKENFKREYLHIFNNDEVTHAFEKEKEYVTKEFTLREDTYNISEGGNINPVMYGENNPFYGKTHSKETIATIQQNNSWYKPTDEHKEKISKASKQFWDENKDRMIDIFSNRDKSFITDEFKQKCSNSFKGKHHTDETKEILRQKRLGKSWGNHTEESKQQIREQHEGRIHDWQNKINNNPEKIKKTADTHRGMKRSEEAKQNMKEAQKRRFENSPAKNKGMKWIYNEVTNERKYILESDELPEGFKYGYGKRK
jgi:hypothetical protein